MVASFTSSPMCEQKFKKRGRAYDILSCEKRHRLCVIIHAAVKLSMPKDSESHQLLAESSRQPFSGLTENQPN